MQTTGAPLQLTVIVRENPDGAPGVTVTIGTWGTVDVLMSPRIEAWARSVLLGTRATGAVE